MPSASRVPERRLLDPRGRPLLPRFPRSRFLPRVPRSAVRLGEPLVLSRFLLRLPATLPCPPSRVCPSSPLRRPLHPPAKLRCLLLLACRKSLSRNLPRPPRAPRCPPPRICLKQLKLPPRVTQPFSSLPWYQLRSPRLPLMTPLLSSSCPTTCTTATRTSLPTSPPTAMTCPGMNPSLGRPDPLLRRLLPLRLHQGLQQHRPRLYRVPLLYRLRPPRVPLPHRPHLRQGLLPSLWCLRLARLSPSNPQLPVR